MKHCINHAKHEGIVGCNIKTHEQFNPAAEWLFCLTWARIEQCKPYLNVGLPKKFIM